MRVAVLDLGSNSFRLLVADVTPDGGLSTADRDREMLHLGAVVGEHGHLPPSEVERSVSAAIRLASTAKRAGASELFCVATSALREATNGQEVVARIEEAIGFPVEIISGQREARLSYRGAIASVVIEGKNQVILYLGGGSLELAYGSDTGSPQTFSEKLGVSRLYAEIGRPELLSDEDETRVREIVRSSLAAMSLPPTPNQIIGVGGTVRAIGDYVSRGQSTWVPLSLNQATLQRSDIEGATRRLAALSTGDRIDLEGVDPARALHLPIAGTILSETLRTLNGEQLVLSDWGLRAGVIFEKLNVPQPTGDDIRALSIQGLVDQFNPDPTHAYQTARLVWILLDQLPQLLNFTRHEAELIDTAARLHSVGRAISLSGAHRHAAYLIENASLRGLSPSDRAMILSIVFSQKGGSTKISFPPYASLPRAQRSRLDEMSAVFQLAESLDRTRDGDLTEITGHDDGSVVRLALRGLAELPDIVRMSKRTQFFEATFSRSLEITLAK
jgi:exopolyphosphatase/guanosine-5'-triphosphate,3'-diphosphate pyrophosphatase